MMMKIDSKPNPAEVSAPFDPGRRSSNGPARAQPRGPD